jgi:DNA-binding response OmpR family regulator
MKLTHLGCASGTGSLRTTPSQSVSAAASRPARILVADDDPLVRTMVSRVLARQAWDVTEVEDGEQALEVCRQQQEPFDLVILDIKMPRLNGYQTHQALIEANPNVRCLFVSGFADEVIWRSITDQGLPYIEKPFLPQQLVHVVRELLAGRSVARSKST